jgi:hypothetical protein
MPPKLKIKVTTPKMENKVDHGSTWAEVSMLGKDMWRLSNV